MFFIYFLLYSVFDTNLKDEIIPGWHYLICLEVTRKKTGISSFFNRIGIRTEIHNFLDAEKLNLEKLRISYQTAKVSLS